MLFSIVSVKRVSPDTVQVRVYLDSKTWLKFRKQGQLGTLYGVDISNAVHNLHGVAAYNPSVSDREKSQGGLKWIDLFYTDAVWVEKTPCEVIYYDFVNKCRLSDGAA